MHYMTKEMSLRSDLLFLCIIKDKHWYQCICTTFMHVSCRSVLLSVMSTARVICYRGQELAAALISHFSLTSEHG